MTDRLKGVLVTFEQDIREDDAERTLNALRMVKGVADVRPLVASIEDEMARDRIDMEWRKKLVDFVFPPKREK